ncbi:histidine--tRNA ligase [Candidatus Mycoplasma haematominutum]|uniref:Histidine--tRNA ligase n=1 Tax=Candidatus Mycoplasma haematominutum 'Birmingham 1' TaxID=1116213 RepID=G8C2W0_9MOLU|nr:histidine--tRNA ligase [Candidatus Mycoplasma haematominutum]CCE66658.1 histidyl-tRNA synthetase [Candidatus Mycoplasma haematominutum 'Birmingham 1']
MLTQPRGTKTLLGERLEKKRWLQEELTKWAEKFNFQEIETPTFEHSELFVGEKPDSESILEKELFYLEGKKYALKPEETAAISRVVFTDKLLQRSSSPLKFFYFSQCFRYERPQKGRFREFTQFGVELIRCNSIFHEIELILSLDELLRKTFNLNLELRINYLSNSDTKRKWSRQLTTYFESSPQQLSKLSQERIFKNPIRILDDKRDSQTELVKSSPKIRHLLTNIETLNLAEIKRYLTKLNVQYVWDESLVRGLDYYTGLVFEWNYNGLTIAGGGRYDEMFQRFAKDADHISSIGMALGLERLQEVLDETSFNWPLRKKIKVYLCYLLDNIELEILLFIKRMRLLGIIVETNWDIRELKTHFRLSEKLNIQWLLIYGEQEKTKGEIILKQQLKNYKIHFSLADGNSLVNEIRRVAFQEA